MGGAIGHTGILPVVLAPERAGDIKHSQASIQKARDLLDYAPVVDFDDGLARTVAWFGDQAREMGK